MQRTLRWVILASGLGVMATPNARAAPTRPTAVVESESLAARAFEAYQRHDHAAALTLYRRALAAAPSADITYNIARVCDLGLQDRACAREFYARYVRDPGAVEARLTLSQRRLAELEAIERGPGATDAVERASGETSLPASETSQPTAPKVRTAPSPTPSRRGVPPTPTPEAEPPAAALDVAAIVAGSMGLVGLSVGVGFGLAARADLEVSERYCDYDRCTSPRGVDAARSASRAANVATAGFVAGGALLGLSAVLWLLDGPDEEPITPGELAIEPGLSLDQVSLTLTGSFGR